MKYIYISGGSYLFFPFFVQSFQSRVTSSQEDVPETQPDSFAAHLNQNRDKYKRKPKKVLTTKRSATTVSLSAKQKEEQKKMMTSTKKPITTTRKVMTTQKTTTTTEKPKVITWPPVKEALSQDVIKALDFSLNLLVWEERKIERNINLKLIIHSFICHIKCIFKYRFYHT